MVESKHSSDTAHDRSRRPSSEAHGRVRQEFQVRRDGSSPGGLGAVCDLLPPGLTEMPGAEITEPMDVCMLVGNEIVRDPRVTKEARTLVRAGYSVGVVGFGTATPGWQLTPDGYRVWIVPPLNRRLMLPRGLQEVAGLPGKIRRALSTRRPPPTPAPVTTPVSEQGSQERQHTYLMGTLQEVAMRSKWMAAAATTARPKVVHAHDLDTLSAATWAARATGAALVFDAHEIWWQQFADGEAPRAWVAHYRALEAELIGRTDRVLTVCDSIADFLADRHGIDRPVVVRNSIEGPSSGFMSDADLHPVRSPVDVLFHGGLSRGRGLEGLIAAAARFEGAVLTIRGAGELEGELRTLVERARVQDRVRFEEPVPLAEVVRAAARHDIGIIPYRPVCLNNRFSTPNKLFEYLHAGLAIAASDLPELRRVVESERVGALFDPERPESIADVVNHLARDRTALMDMRRRAIESAAARHSWSFDSVRLLDVYRGLIPRPLHRAAVRIATGRPQLGA